MKQTSLQPCKAEGSVEVGQGGGGHLLNAFQRHYDCKPVLNRCGGRQGLVVSTKKGDLKYRNLAWSQSKK